MPHTYLCKTCRDTGTVGSLWFKKPCPNCKGDPKSVMPKPPPPKQCNHKCRCKDSL